MSDDEFDLDLSVLDEDASRAFFRDQAAFFRDQAAGAEETASRARDDAERLRREELLRLVRAWPGYKHGIPGERIEFACPVCKRAEAAFWPQTGTLSCPSKCGPAFIAEALRAGPPDEQSEADEKAVEALMAEMLDSADLDGIPPLEPVVSGLLFRDSVAQIYGESESLKSFIAIDIAGCVGTGIDWHGRRTKQGLVVYIVAEGGRGVRPRVRAWEQHHGRKMTGVKFLPRPVQASSSEWGVLVEVCRRLRPVLVMVDTQARVTVGMEENSAKEMGLFIERVEELRRASEACATLVHHSGYNARHGRGSSSVKGALQTELEVTRKGNGKGRATENAEITLAVSKQKDADKLPDIRFRAHVVEVEGEFDADGNPVTSVVLLPALRPEDVDLVEPGSAEDIAARLDEAGVPRGIGRGKTQEACQKLGIKAGTTKLREVVEIRREPVP